MSVLYLEPFRGWPNQATLDLWTWLVCRRDTHELYRLNARRAAETDVMPIRQSISHFIRNDLGADAMDIYQKLPDVDWDAIYDELRRDGQRMKKLEALKGV